ncbi:MAG TPA: hypothetical protein PKA62_15540 [Thermoanaerobaculia bacterium]|nr:hypothetical protein [Thermoanaerobaculia bacterium]
MIGLSVAVVDPGTLVGRDVKAVLRERSFPSTRLQLFHTGDSTSGLLTEDDGEAAFASPLEPDGLAGCQIAFLCGPSDATARFLSRRPADGCLAIDVSGQRGSGTCVDAVRGVLPSPIPESDLLVLRDPAATVLADAIAAAEAAGAVAGVTAAIDRPASDLGKDALDELFQQAIAIASFRSVPRERLGAQSAFNVFSPADTDAFDGRVAEDVRALLRRDLPVTVLSARAGVFHGTTIRLEIRFAGPAPSAGELRSAPASWMPRAGTRRCSSAPGPPARPAGSSSRPTPSGGPARSWPFGSPRPRSRTAASFPTPDGLGLLYGRFFSRGRGG